MEVGATFAFTGGERSGQHAEENDQDSCSRGHGFRRSICFHAECKRHTAPDCRVSRLRESNGASRGCCEPSGSVGAGHAIGSPGARGHE